MKSEVITRTSFVKDGRTPSISMSPQWLRHGGGQKDFVAFLHLVTVSPAFHCGGNARGNARVIKRTRPVPDSCVSMEAFSARVSAPVFDDLCVHLDLPRVYKCEMVSFQLMLTKNRARFTFTSGNSDIVSKFFSACGNARVETLQWKRFYVFLC